MIGDKLWRPERVGTRQLRQGSQTASANHFDLQIAFGFSKAIASEDINALFAS